MRIQVNLADEFIVKLDDYSTSLGISRSAFCAMLIGQGLLAYDRSFAIVENAGQALADSLAKAPRGPVKGAPADASGRVATARTAQGAKGRIEAEKVRKKRDPKNGSV